MELELLVARLTAWAHVAESVVHDPGPWNLRHAGRITPAHRIIDRRDKTVTFIGMAGPAADGLIELWAGDRMVTLTRADLIQECKITWKLMLTKEPTKAS